jgi:hypothetical protein
MDPNDIAWKTAAAAELNGAAFTARLTRELKPVLDHVAFLGAGRMPELKSIWGAFEDHINRMGYEVRHGEPDPLKILQRPLTEAMEKGIQEHFGAYLRDALAKIELVPGISTALQRWAQNTADALEYEIKRTTSLRSVSVTFKVEGSSVKFMAKMPVQPDSWASNMDRFFDGLVDAFVAEHHVMDAHSYGTDYEDGTLLATVTF